MTYREHRDRIVVLALGNDILGDDGLGPLVARLLREQVSSEVDVVITAEAGLAILERLEGYDYALIVDSITTGGCPPGTVLAFNMEDFGRAVAPSPHFSGLPEVAEMAARLGILFPREIRALAMEIEPPMEVREGLSAEIEAAVPVLLAEAMRVLDDWERRVFDPELVAAYSAQVTSQTHPQVSSLPR
jgi:hydrogenase maturation protease